MGFGEYIAFYLAWLLPNLERNTILLLDEPDSHLSAAGRLALVDALAIAADKTQSEVIFTSHSPECLHRLREQDLFLLRQNSMGVERVENRRKAAREMGVSTSPCLLIIVEDVDAAEVVRLALFMSKDMLSPFVDIQIVPGSDKIIKLSALFPRGSRLCSMLAVLDGDQKKNLAKAAEAGSVQAGDFVFLPLDEDPVSGAKKIVYAQLTRFSDGLGVDAETLERAMGSIAHRDYHDFCSDLSEELNLGVGGVPRVRTAMLKIWCQDELILPEISLLIDSIRARVLAAPLWCGKIPGQTGASGAG